MMKRILAGLVIVAGAAVAEGPSDPSLTQMANDISAPYNQPGSAYQAAQAQQNAQWDAARAASSPPAYTFQGSTEGTPGSRGVNADGLGGRLTSALSGAQGVGGDVNTLFTGARNARDLFDAANLLDRALDSRYEPDLSAEGAPDVPASRCGTSDDCNQCYSQTFDSLDTMRMNLEKLRVAGKATADVVSKSYATGDGLAGLTGLGALQWQHERAGIAQKFEHFKGTYDSKYEGMMRGLKAVLDRWNSCEAQYGERDWYARFGFLYYQFLRDKYKRNF